MRVVFMGSPEFGIPTLRLLLKAGHQVAQVVSQPDRPAGRARRLTAPPVAAYAREHGLALYQPERLRTEAALEPIRRIQPDLVVVAAFGLLLPQALLMLPPHGCLNVHPSLLPRYRGASPVEAALLAGEAETGVTIIKLVQQLDAGPILAQLHTSIAADEAAPQLEQRLSELGAHLLLDTLEPWAAGRLPAQLQDESQATYCRRLVRDDAELIWSRPAEQLERVVRAMRGRFDAFTFWDGKLLKVLAADVVEDSTVAPGQVVLPAGSGPRRPLVGTGRGALGLRQIALEGRGPTDGAAFLNGNPAFIGAQLGRSESDC